MPKANQTMIDAGLKKIGFGGLDDPNLFDQIAFVVSGHGPKEGHARFLSLLMSAEPEQRKIAYDAIAPKLRFKALPLEDYIRMGAAEADRRQLPIYNKETLVVEEWKRQEVTTQDYIKDFLNDVEQPCNCTSIIGHSTHCPAHGEAEKMARELHASARADLSEKETQSGILGLIEESKPKEQLDDVNRAMRDEDNAAVAKYCLLLVCERCTLERRWYHLTHREALQTASSDGWTIKNWTPGDKTNLAQQTICPSCKKARLQ